MCSVLNKFSLKNEVIIVTGGAGFLGSSFVEAFIEAGGIPVILDKDNNKIEILKEKLIQSYPTAPIEYFAGDITNISFIQFVCDTLSRKYGKIDVLINNAASNPQVTSSFGLNDSSRFEDMSLSQWYDELNIGLTGAFICSQIFGKQMVKKNKGVIINISSDLGLISPDQRLYYNEALAEESQAVKPVTYSVVKTGILGFTRYLATYWRKNNIRVNAVALGGVYNNQNPEFIKRVHDKIPLGRLAQADEYKASIVYLCSPASSYINGATIVIDGGRTIW